MTLPSPSPFRRSPPRDSERTARVEAIFHEALARASADRDNFVGKACARDGDLRQEVQRLLAAHEEAGAYFEPPNTPEIEAELARLKPEEVGEMIGPYKLVEKIGEGGFGTVWVAEQKMPVRRRVALKILKLGMDTKEVLARFQQERQALALMDHPSIARVIDAGATQYGRPYIVMELVSGVKITQYCDELTLSMRERLELFMAVCQAVQHAHQKGVIHRDLKPSNILVTIQDGVPMPKIIDFGVAKAVEQRLSDLTVYTQFEQMIGTPPYMSPEQAEGTGQYVDTRTDIYALGVLLYELLTGRTPFDAATLMQASYDEIRRIIRQQQPPKPSTALDAMAPTRLIELARHRQSQPPRLANTVRGDLDWIVMKALEKDRARRYETANGFALDVQRHLRCEPVVARPPSRRYRFGRLVRRNQLLFAAIIAVAAVLAASFVTVARLFYRYQKWQKEETAAYNARIARKIDPALPKAADDRRSFDALKERLERRYRAVEELYNHALKSQVEERKIADEQRKIAEERRQLALGNELQTRRLLYAAEMNRVQEALRVNDIATARRLLDGHRPTSGEPDLRGWEWRYLWQRCRRIGAGDQVQAVAASPGGRLRASAAKKANAARSKIEEFPETGAPFAFPWNLRGGVPIDGSIFYKSAMRLKRLDLESTLVFLEVSQGPLLPLRSVLPWKAKRNQSERFSPDGAYWAAPAETGEVALIDLLAERLVTLQGDFLAVEAVAFTPDSNRLITLSRGQEAVTLWDTTTGRELLRLPARGKGPAAADFSEDGTVLLVDGGRQRWHAPSWSEIESIENHAGRWASAEASGGPR